MDSARRWTVVDAPTFAASPDSLDADSGRRGQLYVSQGAFLPDGRVVLLYGGTTQDSVLLHFLDPTSGTESKVPGPRGDDGRTLNWSYFRMAVSDRGLVLVGDNESRVQRQIEGAGHLARRPGGCVPATAVVCGRGGTRSSGFYRTGRWL